MLNQGGRCIIVLPPEFPDIDKIAHAANSDIKKMAFSEGAECLAVNSRCVQSVPFVITYHLTPLCRPMPNLHVSVEVTRLNTLLLNAISTGDSTGVLSVDGSLSEDAALSRKNISKEDESPRLAEVENSSGCRKKIAVDRTQRYCFVVDGGAPEGKVSWTINTRPRSNGTSTYRLIR
jgi:hypothetical protein